MDIHHAMAYGFTCAMCGRKVTDGRAPFRWGSRKLPPFFCTLLCGFDYRASQGDDDAAIKAGHIRKALYGTRNADD